MTRIKHQLKLVFLRGAAYDESARSFTQPACRVAGVHVAQLMTYYWAIMTTFFLRVFAVAGMVGLVSGPMVLTASAQTAGSLIKGSAAAVYFLGDDGKRYVFPNASVYGTWFGASTPIMKVTDAELATHALGGNVTYKPGKTLIKVTTDPKVYAVSRFGVLHWVTSEAIAKALYGVEWNKKVVDVPDVFFANYKTSFPITEAASYVPSAETAAVTWPTQSMTLPETSSVVETPVQIVLVGPAEVRVTLGTSFATQNQNVPVNVQVTGNLAAIAKIEIHKVSSPAALATCLNVSNCAYSYMVQSAPLNETFYAVATDVNGAMFQTDEAQRPSLMAAAVSSDLQLQVKPQTVTVGSVASFSSLYTGPRQVTSHKMYALLPGGALPFLWKDCGIAQTCAGSTPFYRSTSLFSQIMSGTSSFTSPIILASVTGGNAPRPTITVGKPNNGNVALEIVPPTGEMIGQTLVMDGDLDTGTQLALCAGPCSPLVQVNTQGAISAFTWVGGQYERSNVVFVSP